MSARDPEADLPVIEVDADEFAAFAARAEVPPVPAHPAPDRHEEPVGKTAQITEDDFAADFTAPEPQFIDTRFGEDFADEAAAQPLPRAPVMEVAEPPPVPVAVAPATAGMEGLLEELGTSQSSDPPISDIEVTAGPDGHGPETEHSVAMTPPVISEPEPEAPAAPIIVEWPAADASQVLAVRVISVGEKFSGRAVRLPWRPRASCSASLRFSTSRRRTAGRLLSIASLNKPAPSTCTRSICSATAG